MTSAHTINRVSFKSVSLASIRCLVNAVGGDGHTIYNPMTLAIEADLAPDEAVLLGVHSKWHMSDGTPKGTINGDPDLRMYGLYTLDLLKAIACDLGVDYPNKYGRGTQAQAISAAILNHLNTEEEPPGAGDPDYNAVSMEERRELDARNPDFNPGR
jgi:hypothetical protein